jgi:pilus assembly protein CpaC
VNETVNEIELLVMVRPELAEALDPHEVPSCGPGESTMSPTDCELLLKGHLEVPNPRCLGGDCANGNCTNGNCANGEADPGMAPQSAPNVTPGNGEVYEEVPVPQPSAKRTPPPVNSRWTNAQTRTASATSARSAQSSRPAAAVAPSRTAAASRQEAPRYNPPVQKVRQATPASRTESGEPGLIGPTGYDVIN